MFGNSEGKVDRVLERMSWQIYFVLTKITLCLLSPFYTLHHTLCYIAISCKQMRPLKNSVIVPQMCLLLSML